MLLASENNINISTTSLPSTPLGYSPDELFYLRPVTCTEVQSIIMSMPFNKSPGLDKINMRVIKDSLPVILGPLTDIINCSLSTSTYPSTWKKAEVIPLLKDGDHEQASNNRPLSLLPVASKIYEKVVLIQFNSYLLRNNRLSSHQSDAILKAMDNKMLTALVLLDLSKAFDSINHNILLQKLEFIGASQSSLRWFSSYLKGRSQVVRIGSTLSSPLYLTHGVPQGAILSPLLFSIYLNNLSLSPRSSSLESYADDSKVFLSFPLKTPQQPKQNWKKTFP